MKHGKVKTEMLRITSEMVSNSLVESFFRERIIPEKKTILEYRCALDKATRTFFLYASDDDLLSILDDAIKHQRLPGSYKSFEMEDFSTNGIMVENGTISYNESGKVTIKIFLPYGYIKICASKVVVKGRVTITPELGKLISTCQHTIQLMENVLKNKK